MSESETAVTVLKTGGLKLGSPNCSDYRDSGAKIILWRCEKHVKTHFIIGLTL